MASADWWGAHLLARGADGDPWATMGTTFTRGELRARVDNLAAGLSRDGVGEGSTAAVMLPPGVTLLATVLAVWSCGAQVQLLDVRNAPAETARLLSRCAPQYLIRPDGPARQATGPVPDCPIVVTRRPEGRAAGADGPAWQRDVCLVQFSSGSTGTPKVVGRRPADLTAELARYGALAGMPRAGERILLLNSLIHTMGLVGGFLHGLEHGTHLLLPTSQRIGEAARILAGSGPGHGADAVLGVPVQFDLLSRGRSDALRPRRLRLAVSAGEPLPAAVYERFTARYGVPVSPVYGTTETGVITARLDGACPPPGVGRTTGLPVRVRGGGIEVALDHSPYLQDDGTARYAGGWLRTFDRGELDPPSGELRVLGRADSLVTVGGMKIDLTEVEGVLRACPGVEEAVVVFGDTVEAYTAGPARPEELARWCREHLAAFKIPKRYFTVASLPRNANGKILRNRALLHERGQL
ncbi:acyl--CoA ligase [Streptomyces actinomycinicus]|uniref:Acyl--CoA ligase n=1 Tax=Streptomyces actinomycinicus TaxID=1695166 RepID=A0A937EQ56_9ACTN|nr:class I adenylate-forming enzyme family protein [Streptomyces actinomycinicus]MBL1086543.1 acyl--CoA ligase [Streptomyces actinomycinicus]